MRRRGASRPSGLFALAVLAASMVSWVSGEDASYIKEIESWRSERETDLKADGSWLTVAGLFWLRDGESSVGADPTADFVLPEGSAPPLVGTFSHAGDKTTFRAADGVEVTKDGAPIRTSVLEPGEKNALAIKRLSMWLHLSGDRKAIRLRDLDSPIRKEFKGLSWFAVDPSYRVTARFEPYAELKEVEMLNILGDIERYKSPGMVEFELHGETIRMEPLETSQGLWLIFRDGTSGKETYPAARFLRTGPPENGRVVVDFNKAYNPPCVFNPFTTCPVPVQQNRLKTRVEAGEKDYHKIDS